jgi:hypothetical protein
VLFSHLSTSSFSHLLGGDSNLVSFTSAYYIFFMADKRKNTQSFAREHPNIPLYEELPPVTRKSW